MTLASAARVLALLLAPCLVSPVWGGPVVEQADDKNTPNLPAPPQIDNNVQTCPHCAKEGQSCASCGSRFSLLHRKTCKHIHQKPICAPCGLKHYGYYPACYHPWPFPTYYGHCPPPIPPAADQPPWYFPGNPHPPKGDEALPTPTPATPDMKEEPNGEKKKTKDEDTKKDEDAKKKDDKKKDDTEKKDDTKKKDDTDKSNPGRLQGRLLPPLSNYNLSGK